MPPNKGSRKRFVHINEISKWNKKSAPYIPKAYYGLIKTESISLCEVILHSRSLWSFSWLYDLCYLWLDRYIVHVMSLPLQQVYGIPFNQFLRNWKLISVVISFRAPATPAAATVSIWCSWNATLWSYFKEILHKLWSMSTWVSVLN